MDAAAADLRRVLGDTFTHREARRAAISDTRLYRLRDAGEVVALGGGVYLLGSCGMTWLRRPWCRRHGDERRLADCFASVDYFEAKGLPFVVAVNCFDSVRRHPPESITQALNLATNVPVIACAARRRESSRDVLVALA